MRNHYAIWAVAQQYTGGSSSDGFTQVDDDELPF